MKTKTNTSKNRGRKIALVSSILMGVLTITTIAGPADAAPKTEYNQLCDIVGGTYYNTAWGELCVVDGWYHWGD